MTTNYLSPVFNEQTFNASGDPLVGGQIETYVAGTSAPLATYTTQSGTTQQANPIILNARGEPTNTIWLGAGQLYKFVLKDSLGSVIRTLDDIGGINDTSLSVSEWQSSGYTPTYISTVSFSVSGDKTSDFSAGRRIRSTNSGGTIYSTIASSSYSSGTGLTTVTVRNDSGTLDAGLSTVDIGILSPVNPSVPNSQAFRQSMGLGWGVDIASAATLDLTARTGAIVRITGTTATTAVTLANGDRVMCYAVGAWPLTYNATTMPVPGGASYTCSAGDLVEFVKDRNGTISIAIYKKDGTAVASAINSVNVPPAVRQTVLSGSFDSSGNAAFGGSTGSTTVTASGTLIPTAASGTSNRTGSITNPSWTGLSTNGTMYLYLDIASNGTCTTGSTTLKPTYQWGGTYSTTNGQNTFNIQEMTMKVGNGSTASQVWRVFVGQVTISGNVVTSIAWYALMGRYQSAATAWSTASNVTFSHQLGMPIEFIEFNSYNSNSTSGPWLPNPLSYSAVAFTGIGLFSLGASSLLQIQIFPGSTGIFYDNGSNSASTISSGYLILRAKRSW